MGDLFQPTHLLILMLVFSLFFLLPFIFYILTLTRALTKCSVTSITIEPGMLWLLLVPFVNMVWHFFVVIGLAKTLSNEFKMRNITNMEPMPGQSIGIAMCVCGACGIIPLIGLFASLAGFVLWIVYWAKIAEFSRILDQVPLPSGEQIPRI
ncbi:MAG TPA: hypothetical protein VGE85_11635 [Terracidiphilus sp.]|jgi:hypothetical protein